MPPLGLSGASLAPARRLSGSTFVTQLNRIASSAVDACRRRGQLPGPAALPPAFTYRFLQSRYLTALSRIPSPRSPWLRCAGVPSRPQRRGRRGGEQSKKRRKHARRPAPSSDRYGDISSRSRVPCSASFPDSTCLGNKMETLRPPIITPAGGPHSPSWKNPLLGKEHSTGFHWCSRAD